MPLDRVLAALAPHGLVEEAGGWTAHCPGPVHRNGDQRRSLKIDHDVSGGKTLLYCHAGCQTDAVLAALKLTKTDLFDDQPATGPKQNGHAAPKIVATYDYTDEQGHPVFQVVRYEPKSFKQRRPDPAAPGGWTWKVAGLRKLPYHLDELCAHPGKLAFICEGEKDVDALRARGFLATCNAGGAGKWTDAHSSLVGQRHTVLLPDNDPAGYEHAWEVARSLEDIATSVRVLALPGLPPKGDVSDWLAAGGTPEQLKQLVLAAPLADQWQPPARPDEPVPPPRRDGFVWCDDLLKEPDVPRRYVVADTLPVGGISILNARPKTGKSTLLRQLAVAVAAGRPFLGRDTSQGTVLLLTHEEHREDVKAHLRRLRPPAGARLAVFTDAAPADPVKWLKEKIEEYHPDLVIIDTLSAFFPIGEITNNSEMTTHLKPIIALAHESGCHICFSHWMGASREGTMGATSIFGAMDLSLCISRDEEDNRVLWTEGTRCGTPFPRSILKLDPGTGECHLDGTSARQHMEIAATVILHALSQDEPLSMTALIKLTPKRDIVTSATVKALHAKGYLVTDPSSKATPLYRRSSQPFKPPYITEQEVPPGGFGTGGGQGGEGA